MSDNNESLTETMKSLGIIGFGEMSDICLQKAIWYRETSENKQKMETTLNEYQRQLDILKLQQV